MADLAFILLIVFVLIPLAIITLVSTIMWTMSRLGGWHRLSKTYVAQNPPEGKRFTMQGVVFGYLCSYNSCITIHTTPEGFYLQLPKLLRICHPTLFIPWRDVYRKHTQKIFGAGFVRCDLGMPRIVSALLPEKIFMSVAGAIPA